MWIALEPSLRLLHNLAPLEDGAWFAGVLGRLAHQVRATHQHPEPILLPTDQGGRPVSLHVRSLGGDAVVSAIQPAVRWGRHSTVSLHMPAAVPPHGIVAARRLSGGELLLAPEVLCAPVLVTSLEPVANLGLIAARLRSAPRDARHATARLELGSASVALTFENLRTRRLIRRLAPDTKAGE